MATNRSHWREPKEHVGGALLALSSPPPTLLGGPTRSTNALNDIAWRDLDAKGAFGCFIFDGLDDGMRL